MDIEIEYFVNSVISEQDVGKDSALMPYAVDEMNMGLIEYLIKHKGLFSINSTRDRENNALHVCCKNKSVPMVIFEKLLSNGIDVNKKDVDGYTPMDILHSLPVVSSKIQDKDRMMKLMLENGAKYHLVDPKTEISMDKNFFQQFVYTHRYIPADNDGVVFGDPNTLLDAKLDTAMHKLAYEMLFLAKIDTDMVNIFVIFEILLSLSQIERRQLCIKYNNHYNINLVHCITDFFNCKNFAHDDVAIGISMASESIATTLEILCTSNEEYDADLLSKLLVRNNKKKERKRTSKHDKRSKHGKRSERNKLSVEQIKQIVNIVCPKTNYEIRKMRKVFFDKNNDTTSTPNKKNGKDGDDVQQRSRGEWDKDDINYVTLKNAMVKSIENSLDVRYTMNEHNGSINSLYSRKDRDKIVSMKILVNLLCLKRNESMLNNDEFDPVAVPFDMLMEYPKRSKQEYLLRDELDEWIIVLLSQRSWQYIWQFCNYFNRESRYNLHFDKQSKQYSRMKFYKFAMTRLDLPPLIKELLHVTLSIAGCGLSTLNEISNTNKNKNQLQSKWLATGITHEKSIKSCYAVIYELVGKKWAVLGEGGWSEVHLCYDSGDNSYRILAWTVKSQNVRIYCTCILID